MKKMLHYYQNELDTIRKHLREYAEEHPKTADRVHVSPEGMREDPNIERMIQSMALLTARVAKRVDDGYPEFIEALLETQFPHFLRPFPSCSIAPRLRQSWHSSRQHKRNRARYASENGASERYTVRLSHCVPGDGGADSFVAGVAAKGLLISTDGRARAVGGILSRDELVRCLKQALDIAKGLGQAAADHQGGKRDPKPQQELTDAVDALGHGTGNETDATGSAAAGQPVIAISAEGGIASATPKDQIHYAGRNIDSIAGKNQQHYAMGDLHTAAKNIEQFAVDGDVRQIANKGKIIQQAQHNTMEMTADKTLSITSVYDGC
jgi:hypothetical protein